MSSAADRRRAARYETNLRGRIGPVDGPVVTCLVRDYCTGGMLVQHLGNSGDITGMMFRVSDSVQLYTELLTPKGLNELCISATIVWAHDDLVGLRFAHTSDAFVEAIQQHDLLTRAKRAEYTSGRFDPSTEIRCHTEMRKKATAALPGLFHDLLTEISNRLHDSLSSVSSNTEEKNLLEDISTLEKPQNEDNLVEGVLAKAMDLSRESENKEYDCSTGELSLIETEDFERWLAAASVANQLESKYETELNGIASRITLVRGDSASAVAHVPFEPRHFTNTLEEVAENLDLGLPTRKVVFECAGEVLHDRLALIYAGLNEALDLAGAPQIPSHKQIIHRPQPSPDSEYARRDTSTSEGLPAQPSVHANVPEISTNMINAALRGLDQTALNALVSHKTEKRESLARELLSFASDVPNMTESMAEWMRQLNEPLTRQVVNDHKFFENSSHPLREVIDNLWHLQMFRPNPDQNPKYDDLRQQVNDLLVPISHHEAGENEIRNTAAELGRIAEKQSRLYQHNVERIAQAAEGRDRIREARKAVASEINYRYSEKKVPTILIDVLQVGWQAALALAWLKSPEGQDYLDLLNLLDTLVLMLGGEAFKKERVKVDAAALMVMIEDELSIASSDPYQRNVIESRLRKQLLDPIEDYPELCLMPPIEDEEHEASDATIPNDIGPVEWGHALALCGTLVVGDCLRMASEDGVWRDLRIAWIRNDGELFTLVDHSGKRVQDNFLSELAQGVHRNQVEIIVNDGRTVSEKAVDSILKSMEDQISYHASHDSLTGLANRQKFHTALEESLSMQQGATKQSGIILWLDVDQFRLINDIHGYSVGDRLLISIARLLERLAGESILGHLGGDRFAILLPNLSTSEGEWRAEQICAAVTEMPFEDKGQRITLTVSVAVVCLHDAPEGVGRLLQAADVALAAAKSSGGNRAYTYSKDDPEIAKRNESVHWLAQVDEALDRGHLHLRCQPIAPIRPEKDMAPHYEVLLGVHNASSVALPIAEFIGAAERYNRMKAVDRWVTRTVMEWISEHIDIMPVLHGFAVNLSGQTASDPAFVQYVRDQFARTSIDPSWMSFEITETSAVSNLTQSAGIINELKALGCKVALDDFGSGLASYSYLKELPVDWLKIDGIFVRNIVCDREDYAVVKSINEIGQFLGKQTIAEYVADQEILTRVRDIGVDFAQGYAISSPILMDDLINNPCQQAEGPLGTRHSLTEMKASL